MLLDNDSIYKIYYITFLNKIVEASAAIVFTISYTYYRVRLCIAIFHSSSSFCMAQRVVICDIYLYT